VPESYKCVGEIEMAHKSDVAYCPECDAKVSVKSPRIGQIVTCRHCDTRLEIVDLRPLELDWVFEDDFDEMVFDFEDYDAEIYED
jgi:lysine biosynthesis protein LysW